MRTLHQPSQDQGKIPPPDSEHSIYYPCMDNMGRTGFVVVPLDLAFGAEMDTLWGSVQSTRLGVYSDQFTPSSAAVTLGKLLAFSERLHVK